MKTAWREVHFELRLDEKATLRGGFFVATSLW